MKASSTLLLVLITIVFLYIVVILQVSPPANSRGYQPSLALPPPLDTGIIIKLEEHIAAEHATVLRQNEELTSLQTQHADDLQTLQSQSSQLQTLTSQLTALHNNITNPNSNSNLDPNHERDQEINDLKTALAQLQQHEQQLKEQMQHQQFHNAVVSVPLVSTTTSPVSYRPGVIVLGMHRSGTSVIGGLMNKMGLETGGPLIGAAKDNAKGFFERIDVVLQNDYLFKNQNVHYAYNTHKYDAMRGLRDVVGKEDTKFFNEGRRALQFLNQEKNYPWMLKDPRLCITLRTWLPLLHFVPAILFAYRNPYDVALSMHTRETEHFPIQRGLKLWYIYNKRAIKQSHDLCRVVTSHAKVLKDPTTEMAKIYTGLRACGVPVPRQVSDSDIKAFVDTSLQHGKTKALDTLCSQDHIDYDSLLPPATWPAAELTATHLYLYRACLRAFCDIERGAAFQHDYAWDESITNS